MRGDWTEKVTYALEGSIFAAGAAIRKWLRDELKVIDSSEDSEYMANKVSDTHVDVIFAGLYRTGSSPPISMRGTIVGITREL